MQFIAVLLAAASLVLATNTTPTLSSFSTSDCSGTPLATWTGITDMQFCQETPGDATSLNIVLGTIPASQCRIETFTNSVCDGLHGGLLATVPVKNSCFTSPQVFSSVRIVCLVSGR
ncbi:hypothetical protein C8J57DRAFT_1377498 [Mycena rebaudengoi]|nr:hypothetical protein C8J57DRAFT_1377498 [Mycena rebaudengoi]